MEIRTATSADWPAIWPFFAEIVAARQTYAYPPDLTSAAAEGLWMRSAVGQSMPTQTVVATEEGVILGSATMGPNRPGPGSHIGTASFMVNPTAQGRGVGRALGRYVVDWHRRSGFRGIQFNAVVETNAAAVRLWRSLGFEILTTVPGAFAHPDHGFVGLHVMFLSLVEA